MLRRILLKSIIVIFVFSISTISTTVSAHEKGFEITIPQALVAPKIDGVADDAIWRLAPEVIIDNINTGGKVKKDEISTAKAAYDNDNIYVLLINFVLDAKKIITASPGHDKDVWKDEENELFIDPKHSGGKPYYHIMINAKNVTQDDQNGGLEGGWEPKLESATKISDANKNWVLELKIPLKDLDVKKLPVGETWSWNFNRHIVPPDTWTGWATTGPSFHTPARFGDMTFGKEALAVNPTEKLGTTWGTIKLMRR